MVGLILGRDVLIIAGVFAARAQMLGWRWPGAGEFFRLSGGSGSGSSSSGGAAAGDEPPAAAAGKGAGAPDEAPAAPFVEPLYISKVRALRTLCVCKSDPLSRMNFMPDGGVPG